MFNLIKKDFLIVKKVWIGVMLVAIAIPFFLSFASGGDIIIPSAITLTMMSVLLAVIMFSSIDEEEEKYPKAAALMTTIGYSRKIQVLKRYVLMMLIFVYSTIVYSLESLFISGLGEISLMSLVISLFGFTIIASLYLSLTNLFGVRAGRYVVMCVIAFISIGPTIISKLNIKINLDFVKNLNEYVLILGLLILIVLMYSVALKVSINSYENKEL